METIDNNYNSGRMLSEEQKVQFKNSATWMKTYSIVAMIFLGLGFLIFALVFGLMGDKIHAEIAKELSKKGRGAREFFEELWPMAKLLMGITAVRDNSNLINLFI